MRDKHTLERSIFEHDAEHEIGRELIAMPSLSNPENLLFEGPATDRIMVQVELFEVSRHRLACMAIESDPAATVRPHTILGGQGFDSPKSPPSGGISCPERDVTIQCTSGP